MSLVLCKEGTSPDGIEVKTHGVGEHIVHFGSYEITMDDFLLAAHYVLTNADLRDDDPRLQFVNCVSSMQTVRGHSAGEGNEDAKRLATNVPPIPDE